jgi:hypothetical protein
VPTTPISLDDTSSPLGMPMLLEDHLRHNTHRFLDSPFTYASWSRMTVAWDEGVCTEVMLNHVDNWLAVLFRAESASLGFVIFGVHLIFFSRLVLIADNVGGDFDDEFQGSKQAHRESGIQWSMVGDLELNPLA